MYSGLEEEPERFPKELPKGAIGWDDNGNPYYGGRTPFQEWQLRAHANLERTEQITAEQASWDDWDSPNIGAAYEEGGWKGAASAIFSGLFETYEQVSQSVDWALAGGDEESDVNSVQNAWRTVSHWGGETLQRAGSIAYQTKLFFGGMAHVAEEYFQIGAGVGDPDTFFTERYEQLARDSDNFVVPAAHNDHFWRKLGIDDKWIDEYKQGAMAGRMFYTTIWDNTVDRVRGITGTGQAGNMKKEEFMRYMRDNPQANPNVVVKQFENPAAEMWGEIIFDPLNVVEFGAKALTATVAIRRATRYFAEPMNAVGKVLQTAGKTRVSGLIDDAQDAAYVAKLASARMEDLAKVASKESKLASSKTFWQLTNNAKAHIAAQDITSVNQWAWRASKMMDGQYSIDNFYEIQRAIKLTAGNESEVIQGLNILQRFPGYDIVFTEPGTRAAMMMKDAYGPAVMKKLRNIMYNTAEEADELKRLKNAVEYTDEVIEKTTKKFFPTIKKQVESGKKVGGGWRALAKTHEYLYEKGPYKFFNKFFSSIYLGLNPGYAARNFMQNTVQAVIDLGPGGVLRLSNPYDNVARWGGGLMPVGSEMELVGRGAAEAATPGGKVFFGHNISTAAEKAAGVRIYNKVYPETMKKLLRKGLNERELLKQGLTKDEARHILGKILDNKGDYQKVLGDLIVDAKRGFYEVSYTRQSWSRDMRKFATEMGMDDYIFDTYATSDNWDGFWNAINTKFDDMVTAGDGVVDDIVVPQVGSLPEDYITAYQDVAQTFGKQLPKAQEELLFLNTFHSANTNVWNVGHNMSSQYRTSMAMLLLENKKFATGDEAAQYLMKALDNVKVKGTDKDILDFWGAFKEKARVEAFQNREVTRAVNDVREVFLSEKVSLPDMWNKWDLNKRYGDYAGQSQSEVASAIWDEELFRVRPAWEGYRDEAAVAYKQSTELMQEAVTALIGSPAPAAVDTQLMAAWNKAKKFDDFLDARNIRVPLQAALDRGDMGGVAIQFARLFGISTATEAGKPTGDKLLNIINKQLNRSFKSLDELSALSPVEIEKALMAQALGETVGIYKKAGAEGFALLRSVVGRHADDLSPEEMKKVTDTIDAVRAVDEGVANGIESAIKRKDAIITDMQRKGKRMSDATRAVAEEELGVAQANMNDLLDEAAKIMGDANAIEGNVDNLAEQVVKQRQALLKKEKFDPDMIVWGGENAPSSARQMYEIRPQIEKMRKEFHDVLKADYGQIQKIPKATKETIAKYKKAWGYVGNTVEEARAISAKVSLNKRNFILHDYGKKRNFDLALSYLMPYHFWYNRTYAAWLQRTVTHPGTVTAYLDYKDALEKMHGDMPDWWKANLNTNELLGIDSESPFYFNLEHLLNPLNGLTGVDFHDQDKARTWFSGLMQDVGKFGPSIYTPIAWAIGADAYLDGEKEAAAKWIGRAIPQTQAIKAGTEILNRNFGWDPFEGSWASWFGGMEVDPGVWLASGGVDVWESRRIGRAIGWAVENGTLTQEQADQAAIEGRGNPHYDNARAVAQSKRSTGQMWSFLGGPGLKARTQEDLMIDQMDAEYNRFRALRADMGPDEVADSYEYFKRKYPFFSTLMIARRDSDERIASYAYSVLGRIPPGQTTEAYKAMGITRDQVNEFYDSKGIPEDWTEREVVNFTEAIQDMGVLLAMPDDATKQEWKEVKQRNNSLYDRAEQIFGADTVAKVDIYWGYYRDDRDKAYAYKDANPEVAEYMGFMTMAKTNDPLLAKYYASYDSLRSHMTAQIYDELEKEFGTDFWEVYDQYQELKLEDPKKAKAFKKAHPEIEAYQEAKDWQNKLQAERLASYAAKLPEGAPIPEFRPDIPDELTGTQEQIMGGFGGQEVPEYYDWPWAQWSQMLSPNMQRLVMDYVWNQEDLSYTVEQSLEYQLKDMDIDIDLAKALMRRAIIRERSQ
jgi:hypothetical protein